MTTLRFGAGQAADDLFRRLRVWGPSSWRHGARAVLVGSTLQKLAAMASVADGRLRPAVPDVGVHALADQLEVLTADALESGAGMDEVEGLLDELALRLGLGPR